MTDQDKWALIWIEWWLGHQERDQRLGDTLIVSLARLRNLMLRFGIARIPIDGEADQSPASTAPNAAAAPSSISGNRCP